MKIIRSSAVVVAAGLGACAPLHPVPEPAPTFTDQYVRELAGLKDPKGLPQANEYVDDVSSFRATALAASAHGATAQQRTTYVKTGAALADMYCSQFFEKLTRDQAMLQAFKTQTSLAGGLTTGLMGLFEAGSAATGAAGAAFGFLTASVDNVNSSFLLAPNIESVQKLVTDTHSSMMQSIPDAGYDNFPDAQIFLIRYVKVCTFAGIKSLIDLSVKAAVPTASANGAITMNAVSTATAAAATTSAGTSASATAAATAAAVKAVSDAQAAN